MVDREHTFHIPVMGIGYTLTTPIKVAKYGISSVVSLVDDILMEKMRKHLSKQYNKPYVAISKKVSDFRARRITAYLNLLNDIVKDQIIELKSDKFFSGEDINNYFKWLPPYSELKAKFNTMTQSINFLAKLELQEELIDAIQPGSIDVNIMTKLDKPNFTKDHTFSGQNNNDAHAALRGYANSDLESSIVFSAGMNPKLYSYMEEFDDFYPDSHGNIKKKIILKVSDFRSAMIQGKILAKKGLWVSEFRVESGLNCGGHAFATDGYLMGPILEQFNQQLSSLKKELYELYQEALITKNRYVPAEMSIRLSAQGGVGTPDEHEFLLNTYGLSSVGWGTPFLFVPQAVAIDQDTLDLICKSKESDFFTSDISPMNVLFNSVKGNTKDQERQINIQKNRPGSSCPKKYLALNTEFTEEPICTASREYQYKKIKQIESMEISYEEKEKEKEKVMTKSCICVGLGTSALLAYDLDHKTEGEGVSICPGPNGAYFNRQMSLEEIISHIYGKLSKSLSTTDRPDMFSKELQMYIKHFEKNKNSADSNSKKLDKFRYNLTDGISYYKSKFRKKNLTGVFEKLPSTLDSAREKLEVLAG